jgi:hypothetical protein
MSDDPHWHGTALPQACVGCYYVRYTENAMLRLFDGTIPE